jgi:hypothetical protein
MYVFLLSLHSLMRWLVLISLLYAIYRSYRGWRLKLPFTAFDDRVRHYTATVAHIQLTIGVWMYFISPVIDYFLHNLSEAVHIRDIRFFGMEHSLMMLIAIVLITIGSVKAKRKTNDAGKFKTVAVWYSVALVIILTSIPWPFSPFSAIRPYFRAF